LDEPPEDGDKFCSEIDLPDLAQKSKLATAHSGIHRSTINVVNGDSIQFTYYLHRHPGRLNQPPSVSMEEISSDP
jgi:hypothetical protein